MFDLHFNTLALLSNIQLLLESYIYYLHEFIHKLSVVNCSYATNDFTLPYIKLVYRKLRVDVQTPAP